MRSDILPYPKEERNIIKKRLSEARVVGDNDYDLLISFNTLFMPILKSTIVSSDFKNNMDGTITIEITSFSLKFTLTEDETEARKYLFSFNEVYDWEPCHLSSYDRSYLVKKWFLGFLHSDDDLKITKFNYYLIRDFLNTEVWFFKKEELGIDYLDKLLMDAVKYHDDDARDELLLHTMASEFGLSNFKRATKWLSRKTNMDDINYRTTNIEMGDPVRNVKKEIQEKSKASGTDGISKDNTSYNEFYESHFEIDRIEEQGLNSIIEAEAISAMRSDTSDYYIVLKNGVIMKKRCKDSESSETEESEFSQSQESVSSQRQEIESSDIKSIDEESQIRIHQSQSKSQETQYTNVDSSLNIHFSQETMSQSFIGRRRSVSCLEDIDEISDNSMADISPLEHGSPKKSRRLPAKNIEELYVKLNDFCDSQNARFFKLKDYEQNKYKSLIKEINTLSDYYSFTEWNPKDGVEFGRYVDYPKWRSVSDIRYIMRVIKSEANNAVDVEPYYLKAESFIEFLRESTKVRKLNGENFFHEFTNKQKGLQSFVKILRAGIRKFSYQSIVGFNRTTTFYYVDKNSIEMLCAFEGYMGSERREDDRYAIDVLKLCKPDNDGDYFVLDCSDGDTTAFAIVDTNFTKLIVLTKWKQLTNDKIGKISDVVHGIIEGHEKCDEIGVTFLELESLETVVSALNIMHKFNVGKFSYSKLNRAMYKTQTKEVLEKMTIPTRQKNSALFANKQNIKELYAFKYYK